MREVDWNSFNQKAAEAANAAVLKATGGSKQYPEPEDDDLWELWFDTYEANGGKTIIVKPKGRTATTVTEKCKASAVSVSPAFEDEDDEPPKLPPLKLEIIELTFLTDHGMITNNAADWDNTGAAYTKPDWTPSKSNPITHSKGTPIQLTLVIRATGSGTETGQIAAKMGSDVVFEAADMSFKQGRNTITLTSALSFPKLKIGTLTFDWFVKTDRRPKTQIGTTTNKCYVTYSTPVLLPSEPAEGVTIKRMETSITEILSSGKKEPHDIVEALMSKFRSYTLTANSAVPAKYGHPQYTNDKAGAWPMAQYVAQTGECQAICRFVRGILNQVGCPGVVEPVVVWCTPDPLTAKEAPYGQGGLRFVTKTVSYDVEVEERVTVELPLGTLDRLMGKTPETVVQVRKKTVTKKETWNAFLTTGPATVGNDASGSGLNLYEACLKFTYNGETKYYGGGAGVYPTKERVVRAFHSLIWIRQVPQDENDRFSPMIPICKEIVRSFR